MKVLCFLMLLILCGCSQHKDSFYGEKIDHADLISSTELNEILNENSEAQVKLEAEILTTCKMKGCWMTVKLDNGDEMRVTFKDYGFFVPKDSVDGKKTIIAGTIKKDVTDVEALKHFAQDSGETPEEIAKIVEPKKELTFIATGVIIED